MGEKKTLEQLIREMEEARLLKNKLLKEEEERYEREASKRRKEYVQRNKMYEYINYTANSNPSAGGGNIIRRKENIILLIVGGQSNVGTDPATGRIPYTTMPSYLKETYSNVYSYILASGFPDGFTLYKANSEREMGWLDYVLYRLSSIYDKVYFVKRGSGGTTLGESGTEYPKNDLITKANGAINLLNQELERDDYDKIFLWGQGETDALTETNADAYQTNLATWFSEMRSNIGNYAIIYNNLSDLQVTDFPYVSTVQEAQDNNITDINMLVDVGKAELIARYDITTPYHLRDYSHFNLDSAITIGTGYMEKLINYFSLPSFNETLTLLEAKIFSSNPYEIVLTFNKILAPVTPRKESFNITPFRNILENNTFIGVEKNITVTDSQINIKVSEAFYSDNNITLEYLKENNSSANIQDINGNQCDNFSINVINESSMTMSSYTTIRAYNWSSSLDGWFGNSSLSATNSGTYQGKENTIRLDAITVSSSQQFSAPSGTSLSIGLKYIYSYEIYFPENIGFKQLAQYSINAAIPTPRIFTERTYQILRGSWVRKEIEYTATSSTARPQIELANLEYGKSVYVRDFQIKRIN